MNNKKELAVVAGATIVSMLTGCAAPIISEVESPTKLPNLDLGTPSPTPEELGRIQDYCEKLGYEKVNYAATWKVVGEKPFAYSYCSVQDKGIEQFVVVGYQNQNESVTMNQMLIAQEATVDGRTYQVAGINDPKDGVYRAIITVDQDGNQAAFDLRDASNMVIVPPKGDNGIGDQVKGFLDDFFIDEALAAEPEATETVVDTVTPEVTAEPFVLIKENRNLDWSQEISGILGLENADVVLLKKYTLNVDNGDGTYDYLNLVVDGKKVYATTWNSNDGQNKDIKVKLTLSDLNLKQDFGGGYTKDFISTREDGTLWIIDPVDRQERLLSGLTLKPGGDGMMYLSELNGESRLVVGDEIIKSPENEIVIEGMVGVRDDLVFGGKKIDQEAGKILYELFLDAIAKNVVMQENYWKEFISGEPTKVKVLDYLRNHDYKLPPGFIPYSSPMAEYVDMDLRDAINKDLLLDGLKVVVYSPNEWTNNIGGIHEYIENELSDVHLIKSPSGVLQHGTGIDKDGRIVIVIGTKVYHNPNGYFKPNEILGGDDGVADFPNDGDVAAVYLLSVLKCFSDFNPNWSQGAFPFHPEDYAYSADWGDLIELKLDGKLLIY